MFRHIHRIVWLGIFTVSMLACTAVQTNHSRSYFTTDIEGRAGAIDGKKELLTAINIQDWFNLED